MCTAKLMQMMPKHIFWPTINRSSLYATGDTRVQGVFYFHAKSVGVVTASRVTGQRWQLHHLICCGRKPPPYANVTALSFIEPELLPTEALHCGNRECRIFLPKILETITIFVRTPTRT